MTKSIYKVQGPFLSATDLSTTANMCTAFWVAKGVGTLCLRGLGSHGVPPQGRIARSSKSKYKVLNQI